jgi:hypothetical protein
MPSPLPILCAYIAAVYVRKVLLSSSANDCDAKLSLCTSAYHPSPVAR